MDKCPKEIAQIARSIRISEDSEIFELLRRLCKGYNTPMSNAITTLISQNKYREVLDLYSVVKPEDYSDPDLFFQDRSLVSFLAKYPFKSVTTGRERKQRALQSVVSAEAHCRKTNALFQGNKLPLDVQPIIQLAQRKIQRVLGPVSMEHVLQGCRFGPGQTLSITEPTRTGLFFKLSCGVTATASLLPFADSFFRSFPGWALAFGQVRTQLFKVPFNIGAPQIECVNHNRITTVPKTALSDRPIAVEPHLNQFLQLGVGAAIRDRLKRVGIDIKRAQPVHRQLAQFASIYPSILATIDLSSASDTIAYRVVETLLPGDWFYLLNLLRSPFGLLPNGEKIEYEKFSSMGNGYTFELETLIFWAICSACNDVYGDGNQTVSVYGDDMIVPTSISSKLLYFLEQFGFIPNQKKSYTSDQIHFRESCGGDYYLGRDVRPTFLTSELDNALRIIELANRLRWEHTANNLSVRCNCSSRYLWLYLLDRLPDRIKRSVASLPGLHGWARRYPVDEVYHRPSDYHNGDDFIAPYNTGCLWVPPEWFKEKDYYYDSDIQALTQPTLSLVEQPLFVSTSRNPQAAVISGAEGTTRNGRVPLRDVTRISVRHVRAAVVSRY